MTIASRTQNARIRRQLEIAGRRGIDATQFIREPTVDGLEPILALSSRIAELRAAGLEIETAGRRNRCKVYRLAANAAPSPTATRGEQEAASDTLLAPDVGTRRPAGPYEVDA